MPGSAGGPLCLQFRELGHIGFTAHIVTYLTVANFCERYGCTSVSYTHLTLPTKRIV